MRSFVRREGRLTPGQRQALDTLGRRYGLDSQSTADLDAVFGRRAPRHLEIGCGAGDLLEALAAAHPDNDYLGVEVYRPGLGRLLARIHERGLANVRLVGEDAVEWLAQGLAPASLDAVYVYFPDPWPKKRHHKRRLVQPPFAALLRSRLKSHGRVFMATDWDDYGEQMLAVMEGCGWVNLAGSGRRAPRPRWRPLTRYERRALRLGHEVQDFVFAPGPA